MWCKNCVCLSTVRCLRPWGPADFLYVGLHDFHPLSASVHHAALHLRLLLAALHHRLLLRVYLQGHPQHQPVSLLFLFRLFALSSLSFVYLVYCLFCFPWTPNVLPNCLKTAGSVVLWTCRLNNHTFCISDQKHTSSNQVWSNFTSLFFSSTSTAVTSPKVCVLCCQGCWKNERQHSQARQHPRLGEEFPPSAERVEDGEDRSDRHPALRHLLVTVLQCRSHSLCWVKLMPADTRFTPHVTPAWVQWVSLSRGKVKLAH